MRQVRFTASARKHRIGKARALRATEQAGEPLVIPATEGLDQWLLFIGDDDRGVTTLGAIAIQLPDCLLITHIMPYAFRRRSDG